MQSGMFLHDAALRIDHKSSGQGRNAAVRGNHFWRGHDNWIVDSTLLREFQYARRRAIVFGNADNLQVAAVLFLQRDQFWNFLAARRAPGGPEIHEDNFPAPVRQGQRRARNIALRKRRSHFRVLNEANNRSLRIGRRRSRLRCGFGFYMQASRSDPRESGAYRVSGAYPNNGYEYQQSDSSHIYPTWSYYEVMRRAKQASCVRLKITDR